MSKKCLVLVALLLGAPATILAQADSIYRPVSISCVPGLSTNGFPGTNVTSHFSFNILGGMNARVVGAEIGSILNINTRGVVGVQLSGITNVNAGSFKGLQVAGVGNFVGEEFSGLQSAGVLNMMAGSGRVVQVSGVANIAGGTAPVQVGVINIAMGETYGQVGVINIAGHARGAQVGVVNVAEKHSGAPVGIVSLAGDGPFHLNCWTDETSPLNVGLKYGSRYVYNVFEYGINPLGEYANNKLGLGIGGHVPFDPLFLDITLVGYGVYEKVLPVVREGPTPGMLSKLRFNVGWQISPTVGIFAGPSFNLWFSQMWDGEHIPLYGLELGDFGEEPYTDIWLGFSAGVQLF